jgi:hypothetical protein
MLGYEDQGGPLEPPPPPISVRISARLRKPKPQARERENACEKSLMGVVPEIGS